MSGGLLPETVAALKSSRASALLFSNMISAELFDAAHTLGERRVMPRTDGKYIVYDAGRPVGDRTESVHKTVDEADAALRGSK